MLLVGTPGPEILTKMSSVSVSVSYHPAPSCPSALSVLCLRCISDRLGVTPQAAPIWTIWCVLLMAWFLLLCFLANMCYELHSCNHATSRADVYIEIIHHPVLPKLRNHLPPSTVAPLHTNLPNCPNHPMFFELHVTMPLNSEALDINQLQQIMRLTGTPPASLISRMPSHEVRHVFLPP